MSVYLQFDSSARTNPFIQKNLGAGLVWVPNDNYSNSTLLPYQPSNNLVQTPTKYRVFYRELNDTNNTRTIGFLSHCRERLTNLTYSVESCVLTMPANGLVPRTDEAGNITYISILDEPYLYVRMMPSNHAEGDLIYSNNHSADEATFVVWMDRVQPGTDGAMVIPDPIPRPTPLLPTSELTRARWIIYKSCMHTVMRLDLAEEWYIRIYDRFGNDVVLAESNNDGDGFTTQPAIDPDLQTMLLVGIKPNYPV